LKGVKTAGILEILPLVIYNRVRVWIMVFNTTFNNISVILWWSVLLMEETGENTSSEWDSYSQH
jgi:hypothetical protein